MPTINQDLEEQITELEHELLAVQAIRTYLEEALSTYKQTVALVEEKTEEDIDRYSSLYQSVRQHYLHILQETAQSGLTTTRKI